ncbi:MAG TPA: EamA family transporter, partial [Firmicutes bacterium]|nr:EamA family transporter [Bacillota bacterium]
MASGKRITAILVGGVLAISTSAVLVRLAEAPPLVIAFYRMALATLFFTPSALGKSRRTTLSMKQL